MSAIGERWAAAWRGLGAQGDGSDALADLLRRYGEDHRRYHTIEMHIAPGLELLGELGELIDDQAAVDFAFFYHDAIYDPRAADNEERSAALARAAAFGAGVDEERSARIAAMIEATKHPAPAVPPDRDTAAQVDVDLSVLGAEREDFDAYDRAIRQEYLFVPWARYRATRGAVLRAFLSTPAIYHSAELRDRFESRARANLARALAALERAEEV